MTNEELYGTSGIKWRQVEPKVWELSNTPESAMGSILREAESRQMSPEEYANYSAAQARQERQRYDAEKLRAMTGAQVTQKEFDRVTGGDEVFAEKPPRGAYGRDWRRAFRRLEADPAELRGLFNRGDVWIDKAGDVYSYFPLKTWQMDRLMSVIRSLPDQEADALRDLSANIMLKDIPRR